MTDAPPFLAAAALDALGWDSAIAALADAFRDGDPGALPARAHLDVPGGELLLMPAHGPAGVGVKLVTLAPGNPERGLPFIHGAYVLFAPGTLAPRAIVDGAALTAVRTAAVSALATRHLAREDAQRLVIFGAGTQARAHAAAMRAVRPVARIDVVGTGSPRGAELVAGLRAEGVDARLAGPEAVREADLVCTCTTSAAPVFAAGDLRAGAHVNAVGAYRPDLRELEAAVLARATLVVETRESALAEAGDVLQAIGEGALAEDDVQRDLAAVVRGEVRRTGPDEVTVFKSVGLAFEDLAVAAAAAAYASGVSSSASSR